MQNIKVIRAIKVIKLKGKRIAAIVPATVSAVALAQEIQAKMVSTVKNWITERRANDLAEKAQSDNALQAWREEDDEPNVG